jgi:hypothetical protein
MRSLASVCMVLLLAAAAFGTQVSGPQSGTWTLAGSPYELIGDVQVSAGEMLLIEPGVVVNALGPFKITVTGSTLQALGTSDQPILMTAADHAVGWRGLRLIEANDDTLIDFCTIEYARNTAAFPEIRGGAIYILSCSPTVSNCELRLNYSHNSSSNGAGAGVAVEDSSAIISDNYIHDNYADSGAGVCCMEYGTPLIARNLIANNNAPYAGGGIYLGARNSAFVLYNIISGNTAGGWGGGGINSWTSYIFYGTYPTIRDNLIVHNMSTSGSDACGGGGIYCRYDRAIITNNTLMYNQAVRGGGLYVLNYPDQAPQVSNGILWANTASTAGPEIFVYSGAAVSVTYSDVQGGWAGLGNRDADPLLVDPGSGDYRLSFGSPCIDTGDPAFVPQPGETDLDGNPRLADGDGDGTVRVDMGACEFEFAVVGDLNCDGLLNAFDIDPFVLALTDPVAYATAYADCDYMLADVNGDGAVNAFDIDPFVLLLTGD